MFRSTDLTQDLKLDILTLKKQLAVTKEDNQLLKVKIRKLQSEISKRDRQIETLVDPRKFPFVKKVVSEKGASMLLTLQERNIKLEKILIEKDLLIKRLQNDQQTRKLYSGKPSDRKKQTARDTDPKICNIDIPYYEQNQDSSSDKEDDKPLFEHSLKSASMLNIHESNDKFYLRNTCHSSVKRAASADRSHFDKLNSNVQQIKCVNDVKAQYEGLSRDHLLSIIESLKNNQHRLSPCIRKTGSPESDLDRNELLCDTPHREILQLQNYFMDMFNEVDALKTTINSLHSEQKKTTSLLKQKDNNITYLAKEIQNLKRPKSELKNKTKLKGTVTDAFMQSHHLGRRQTKSASNAKLDIEKEFKEEVLNSCIYSEVKELEPQQAEKDVQIIRTRTISIQKLEDPPSISYVQGTSSESELKSSDNESIQSSPECEQERRRETYNNLLEQMMSKT